MFKNDDIFDQIQDAKDSGSKVMRLSDSQALELLEGIAAPNGGGYFKYLEAYRDAGDRGALDLFLKDQDELFGVKLILVNPVYKKYNGKYY